MGGTTPHRKGPRTVRPRTPLRPIIALATGVLLAAGAAAPAVAAIPTPTTPPGHEVPAPGHGALDPLVRLSAQRLLVADEVAAAKWGTGAPIEDPARERLVLDAAAARARRAGADPVQAVRFFRDQIEAAKVVEETLFTRWSADPASAPAIRPPLSGIRTTLDGLNDRLSHALADTAAPRAETGCDLALAVDSARVATELDLDLTHRVALARALPATCD